MTSTTNNNNPIDSTSNPTNNPNSVPTQAQVPTFAGGPAGNSPSNTYSNPSQHTMSGSRPGSSDMPPLASMLNEAASAGQQAGEDVATSRSGGAGTKRTRSGEAKYYAVKAGFKPGLYDRWEECMAQVKGYKGALFQSFPTIEEANDFLAGRASQAPADSSAAGSKFYAVQRGRQPGVYTDWSVAQDQVRGFPAPRFRRFATWAEADEFVRQGQPRQQQQEQVGQESAQGGPEADRAQQQKQEESESMKAAPREAPGMTTERPKDDSGKEYPPGRGPLPRGAFDGFDPNILLNPKTGQLVYKMENDRKKTKVHPKPGSEPPGMLNIYTDGSTLKNGRLGAKAGVGVYFGPGDDRNVSEPLKGSRQTNQRAELTAIVRALDIAPRHRDITIYSDSQYAINAVTVWSVNWRRNSWMTADRRPVENKDLVQSILSKIDERNTLDVKTLFEWVKGHNNDEGNVAADRLARAGAEKPGNGGGGYAANDDNTATATSSETASHGQNKRTSSSQSSRRSSRSPNGDSQSNNGKRKPRRKLKRTEKWADNKETAMKLAEELIPADNMNQLTASASASGSGNGGSGNGNVDAVDSGSATEPPREMRKA